MSYDIALDNHVLNIIQNNNIHEQSDLQAMLKERGYDIPQATLSRRLKKLEIAKVGGVYKAVEFKQSHLPLVLNMQISEFGLIVLHTNPGQANSLAYFFDQKYISLSSKGTKSSGMLGTIAGDDTVLLIVKSKAALKNVLSIIKVEFPYLTFSE